MPESEKNRACWNCWLDEFCSWAAAGDEDACEEYLSCPRVEVIAWIPLPEI